MSQETRHEDESKSNNDEVDAPPAPTFQDKAALYAWLARQVSTLVEHMSTKFTPQANCIIGLSNVAALCFYELNRFVDPNAALHSLPVNWFGFYLLQAPGILALGPFQGRPACTEIRVGRGVCGSAAAQGETLVVRDVHAFPSHIACDALSRSEVVVPIKSAQGGNVLGVMDVDSQLLGHFDQHDKAGLEQIAEILARHVEFPMQRALAVNPSLASADFALSSVSRDEADAMAAAASETKEEEEQEKKKNNSNNEKEEQKGGKEANDATRGALAAPGKTRVTGIAHFTIAAMTPETTVKAFHGWQFVITRLDRILTQAELAQLEAELGITAFPEIQFPYNSLRIAREDDVDHPVLSFDALAILRAAKAFYTTEEYTQEVQPQLVLPVSEAWAQVPYARVEAKVDWAWRHNYFGVQPPYLLRPLLPGMRGINWDLLRDQRLQILLFDAFDFMEDDLHDRGLMRCSIKFRAMPTAFFVLFRHLVRVDRHRVWLREVRYFHEFAEAMSSAAQEPAQRAKNHLIIEEQLRTLAIDGSCNQEFDWHGVSEDVLSQRAEVISTKEYYVEL